MPSSYTYQQAQDDVAGIIHGKNVSKVTNINAAARRAGRNLIGKIDLDETRVIVPLYLYDQVLSTEIPDDVKEKGVVDIRPQFTTTRGRPLSDNLSNRMSKDFDMRRGFGSWFTIINNKGSKYARIKAELTPSALTLDDLTELGGWTAPATGGNKATSLAIDETYYPEGALEFNVLSGGTAGWIQSTTLDSQDLTDYVNKSAAFFELYIPNAAAVAAITSIEVAWGSDLTADFYSQTVTAPHFGDFQIGKNIIRIDWNGATKTGSPVVTAIDSAKITINKTSGVEIDSLIVSNLFFSIATIWELEYYSSLLFSDSAGNWKNTLDDTTDLINLEESEYNLWLYEFVIACLQQIQGENAKEDRDYFQGELYGTSRQEGLYEIYKKNNPSQREKVTSTYYNNLGFRGSGGGRKKRG